MHICQSNIQDESMSAQRSEYLPSSRSVKETSPETTVAIEQSITHCNGVAS